jgi:hypothetical protein
MAIIFEIEHTTTRSAISSTRALREIQAQLLSLFNKKRPSIEQTTRAAIRQQSTCRAIRSRPKCRSGKVPAKRVDNFTDPL